MARAQIVIIGAGIGGLTAAVRLASAGMAVTVCEAQATPGGKLREIVLDAAHIDAGPTVFTMRPVFERIFAEAGTRLEDHITLEPLDILARHAWDDGARLDLYADPARNEAAITAFAGAEAGRGYAKFAARAAKIYETLDASFMQAPQPGLLGLMRHAGPGLLSISPFASLWEELGKFFPDPKLRQLFARYATYCGSSPFAAPATLMLIAHAERLGVWAVKGGMFQLALALFGLAESRGAVFRYNTKVTDIITKNGAAAGVRLAGGEVLAANAVIANADLAALDAGRFGAGAKTAVAGMMRGATRSFSAMTWACTGTATGFPLSHHNVFFSNDYQAEFAELARGELPSDPTVYVCASATGQFFCLVNAQAGSADEPEYFTHVLAKLQRCGLTLTPDKVRHTGPGEFGHKFPGSGGALYGRALAGWKDSFDRPGSKTRLPGLYLAGGAVHPGPGLPMAAQSGRLAAAAVLGAL
jgi:1-hydroxycarotenoid 3,4-desaturase